ncbi:MAG: carbon-nitrogen hydrolase family protein [Rugosibacter sp.]|nr:carbon-nitrogen hydrolase family protein [Rugosibacter sp.]
MKLAALQMISGPVVKSNLDTASRLINEAATAGAQLVVLPEYFPLIGASNTEHLAAREVIGHGPIQDFLSAMAHQHGLWLVGGSLPLVSNNPEKMRNTCLGFNPQGERVARYDKIHLFGFYTKDEHFEEAATIEAGDQVVTCDTPCGRVGLSICYDLRFAELYRRMGEVNLIVVPAAFTETTGRAHWEILLRARAIENQCYVVAAAQGGLHPNGRMTHGNSMIIDPWGEILARMDKGEGVIMADFDPQRLADIRTRLPALQHRIL